MKLDNVEDIYPLSPLQMGILFESLYARDGVARDEAQVYVEQFSYRLRGDLDAAAFERAWAFLVARHAVLRTAFYWDGLDKPLQVVRKSVPLPFAAQDWRGEAEGVREERLRGFLIEDRARGFAPEEAPLMRLSLIRLRDDEHCFVWSHHHLLLDGWCVPILVRELIEAYNAETRGARPLLPASRPYRDFIQWLQQQDAEKARGHWRAMLADVAAPTPLLASLPQGGDPEAGYGYREFVLPRDLSGDLDAFARANRLTLNTLFQGAWAALLARYCRAEDIVFGATVSGRPPELRGVEEMVGLFINTLPVRVDFREGESLVPWLARIQERQKAQDSFSYSSLTEVQRESGIEAGTPLFESLLVFENFPVADEAISRGLAGDLRVETMQIVEQTNYPLTLAVLPGEEIALRFYFDGGRIAAATVAQLARQLQAYLANMLADPAREPLRVPLLDAQEGARLLERFAARATGGEAEATLHRLFEAQAAATPDAVALTVVDEAGRPSGAITYAALDARANRLAHHLLAQGLRPEDRVGLSLDPSIDLIVGMLAILKAGGCYVPIDPETPRERRDFIMQDAQAKLLLTDSATLARLDVGSEGVVLVDAEDDFAGYPSNPPESDAGPASLAYVIYTSGSTGRPKGVLVEHRNVARLFARTRDWFGFGPSDVWVLFHSFAFDFSVWEIWGALLHGGRLVIPPYLLARSPRDFHRMARREGVTILNQTPSAYRQFIQADAELAEEGPLALREVIFGGEALDFAMLQAWFARHREDAPRLVNMYGITETTVHVTYRPITARDAEQPRSLIGEPIPDLGLRVLDADGAPVPPGVPGELYVGGAGVARGYLARPELTAERFVRLSSSDAEFRWYCTGDLVRIVADAAGEAVDIEYLGRIDEQVKIRGFRIETGEIAARIAAHPAVGECLVMARGSDAEKRLVAYVAPDANHAPALRRRLAALEDGAPLAELPNGMRIAHLNEAETRFLYREIFEDASYLRHGVSLRPGDVVFDVGANIGVFSLYAAQACDYDLTLYAFEPAPPVFEALARNFELHAIPGRAEPLGVSNAGGTGTITYFPNLSIMSGRGADRESVREAVLAYEGGRAGETGEIVEYKLESREVEARFVTLSDAIRRNEVARIDLLKIDVENSELEVLEGIDEEHWPLIRQIVVEVHDRGDRLARAGEILRARGFSTVAERDAALGEGSPLVNLYARREAPREAREAVSGGWRDAEALERAIRGDLEAALPAYMIPTEFVFVPAMPLTRNGKIDRAALAKREARTLLVARERAQPQGEAEILLAGIWREVLGLDETPARDDDFFALGGHSLLATRVMSRIRDAFAVDIPIRALFEHPSIARLAERISAFRRERAGAGAEPIALPPVTPDPASRYEPFPLTEIQQAYWIGREAGFELGNVATHGYMEVDCRDLDLGRFERAWRSLVERHDMLRMVVLPGGRQQVRERVEPYTIAVTDLRGRDPGEREAEILRIREAMSHQMLDAQNGPLFEIRACLLDEATTRLHLSIDALWGDAHSLRVLIVELFRLHREPDLRLPPLALTFRDYVVAEEAWRDTDWYRDCLRYWTDRLPDFPQAPQLPLRVSPSSLLQPRFTRRAGGLDAARWSALKKRAGRAGLTPSGLLLAAFAEILAFWSKSPRFAINLTLFNRNPVHPDVNRVIGDFTSLILLAVDNSATDGFEARARRLQRQLWSDIDHRFVNGVTVLRELARRQGEQRSALMPVVFTSTLGLDASAGGAAPEPLGEVVWSITQTPQVWLDHKAGERDGALKFEWDAIDELFPEGLLDEMFEAYRGLLDALSSGEEAWSASNAARLPPAAQTALQEKANDTRAPVPQGLLHTAWREQAARAGDRPAVIAGDVTLSYRELEARANRLGRALRERGARGGELVAIVMEKGWQQVAGVLGVLESGAAYVPIDPEAPPERLAQLLASSEARIVVTQARLAKRLPWPEGLDVIAIDGGALEGVSDAPLDALQRPEDLAYVIFTSGSTGVPKGVMIDHRGALNTCIDINSRFKIGAGDKVLALSALTFDLSVYDVFGILAAGATIVMPDPAQRREPGHWAQLMERHGVSVWNTVPALMQMLVDHLEARDAAPPADLRVVMMSGDWIPLPLPERIRTLWPDCRQYSLGGATEASIWSIFHPIERVDPAWKSIPYGRPLANQTLHVLDAHLAPRPVHVPGELFIGGIGLALGYWRDPEKTARSFVTHPLTGERLYRTGDLGRWLPDGEIEFLGREDHQIKLRGYRIELGEIEAALLTHPQVREAVAGVYGERHEGRLVAHVVMESAAEGEGEGADPDKSLEFKLSHPGRRPDVAELPATALALPDDPQAERAAFLRRRSHRRFRNEPVPLEELGLLLADLRALDTGGVLRKYRYPSAGNLYPLQTYLAVKEGGVAGLEAGLHYHDPLTHRLLRIGDGGAVSGAIWGAEGSFNRRIEEEARFAIFLVARPAAIEPIYGGLARDFCLLEAGYLSQLLMERAPDRGIGLCPIGSVDFEAARADFRLESDQFLLHVHLGGLPDEERGGEGARTHGEPADLASFLAGKLPDYMIPSAFVSLPALPLTANGKLDRAALSAPESLAARGEGGAPRDWLEHELEQIWQELLGRSQRIGTGENFFDLGGDSLVAARLATQAAKRFESRLLITDIFRNPTIAMLAQALRSKGARKAASSLVPIRPRGSLPPFFCFPGSGGHALYLHQLARHMEPERPFYALQPMSLDGESAPLDRIEDMSAHYLSLIREVQPRGPYHLGGHSLGAKVALEVAQQLLQVGEEVAGIAVFDSVPFYAGASGGEDWDDLLWIAALLRTASEYGGAPVTQEEARARLAPLLDEERLLCLKESLEANDLLPSGSSLTQVRAILDTFRANTRANSRYREKPVLPVPVTLFTPQAQTPDERAATLAAWEKIGPVTSHVTPGTHLTMMGEPHVAEIAALLDRALAGRS